MRTQITQIAESAIKNRLFPGCVVGIVHESGERQVLPYGTQTYDGDSLPIQVDTIYDTASITKAIPTASIAHQLIEEGKLRLSDRLINYVPEFANSDRELVSIKHLLTYTLDGYGLADLKGRGCAGLMTTLLTRDFGRRPGTVFRYSNIPAALLGLVIERITSDTIDQQAEKRFFSPLCMTRTTFHPEKFPIEDIAPTEHDDWRGVVHGIVHDESAYVCKREGRVVGHAGLFSTAPDILNFLEMLLTRGTKNGKTYFKEETVDAFSTNQIAELGDYTGLGWELNQPRYMGDYCTPKTFGKTGFTGTLCVCDVGLKIAYVILSNRTFPHRSADSSAINAVRKQIGEVILGSRQSQI